MSINKLQGNIQPLDQVNKINELVDFSNTLPTVSIDWTSSYNVFLNGAISKAETSTLDFSNYLPNDGKTYEVLFRFYMNASNTSFYSCRIYDGTFISSSDPLYVGSVASEVYKYSTSVFTLPIGTSRSLTVEYTGALQNRQVQAFGYRVVEPGVAPIPLPVASTTTLGGVKIDGTSITIDNNGVISSTGGSPITVDSELSSTSENPVQNRVLYPSLSGFIPAGTVISVETDETGDFTKLSDALNYLIGKWSNGKVTIQLGAGTFTESSGYTLYGKNFNIPAIEVIGNGVNSTIINYTTESEVEILTVSNVSNIYIHDIKFTHTGGSTSTKYWGIKNTEHTKATYSNCTFDGLASALISVSSATVNVHGNITFTKARTALAAQYGGTITSQEMTLNVSNSLAAITISHGGRMGTSNSKITVSNTPTCLQILNGGLLQLGSPTFNLTSVTTPCNITPNTITANGIAMGFTLN